MAAWLESKNLSQYAPNFLQNEINGSVLMDISLEDLDYMGITILGHRKTILKGIEEISSGKKVACIHIYEHRSARQSVTCPPPLSWPPPSQRRPGPSARRWTARRRSPRRRSPCTGRRWNP